MITLYNVIDTRTDQFHSVAIVKERNVKWFIPVVLEGENDGGDQEDNEI